MSGPARVKRLTRELQECKKDTIVQIEQVGDSIDHFIGSFPGPTGTPYEGGWFRVDVTAPERYPFEPLKMKFITKVYHPNVSSASGYICLDILKTSWSPVFTLRTCLVSLQSLLSTPEPTDPQDAEVAKHYLTDRESFKETAKFWTEVYAAPPSRKEEEDLEQSRVIRGSKSRTHSPSPSPPPPTGPSTRSSSTSKRPRIEQGKEEQNVSSSSDEMMVKRQAKLGGLDWKEVEMFTEMGFEQSKVVEVLKKFNWRKGNKERCSEDEIIGKLIQ